MLLSRRLEREAHPEAEVSCIEQTTQRGGTGDLAVSIQRGDGSISVGGARSIGAGNREVRGVGDVQAFGAELHTQPLPYLEITEDAGIKIRRSRPAQRIEAAVPESGCCDGSEGRRIEP